MTLAPRVQVYTQLSCNALHRRQLYGPSGIPSNHSLTPTLAPEYIAPSSSPVYFPHFSNSRGYNGAEVPWQFLSQDCLSDPAVQSGAASLQTTMATIMGILSVCSTTWWGHYGQKHGRTKVLAASTLGVLFTDTPSFIPSPFHGLSRPFTVTSRSRSHLPHRHTFRVMVTNFSYLHLSWRASLVVRQLSRLQSQHMYPTAPLTAHALTYFRGSWACPMSAFRSDQL